MRLWPVSVFLLLASAAGQAAELGRDPAARGPAPLPVPDKTIAILAHDHGDASPWAEFFAFDSPSHPKIVQLRKDYRLDEQVAGATTDLQRAVALKRWLGTLWTFGTPKPDMFQDWSAVTLLQRAKRGDRGWCGQVAMIYQQACLAVGLPARFIEVGTPQNPACHFTTEVYLREFGKWAVIDATPVPQCNVYYTVGNVPQSALEMHRHVVEGTMDRVSEVHPDRWCRARKEGGAWWFYLVRWLTRCDVVSHTPQFIDMENVFDRRWGTVQWADDKTVPWERQAVAAPWIRNERMSAWTTSDPEVVGWRPTDRVRMALRGGDAKAVLVQLWAADLDFDRFQVRIDGGAWQDLPRANTADTEGPRYGWGPNRFSVTRAPGVHEARCRLVRRDGSFGAESYVRFKLDRTSGAAVDKGRSASD